MKIDWDSMNTGQIEDILKISSKFGKNPTDDNLPYVLNGPIHLILFGIFTMNVQIDILHNYSMLQGLLQICKIYWGHNSVRMSEPVYPSDHLILQYFFQSTSIVKSKWGVLPPRIIFPEYACLKIIRLIHVSHIRRDDITMIHIFKDL